MINLVLGALALVTCLVAACDPTFTDVTEKVLNSTKSLSTPLGTYNGVAWLTGSQLGFEYSSASSPHLWDEEVALYTLAMNDWYALQLVKPPECKAAGSIFPKRLPDGNLGFIFSCELGAPVPETLYMWDHQKNSLQEIERYPLKFYAGDFAFAPDMSEWIQESPVGILLSEQLYRASRNGKLERLFPDYQRVRSPSWSFDGRTIAFMGTRTYPGAEPTRAWTLPQIFSLVDYPWDLYLMNADGSNVHIILSGITSGRFAKWLPQDQLLAFTGTYGGRDGIWVVNPTTSAVTRIWPYATAYDLSPDGRQMIVIQRTKQGNADITQPAIVDIPVLQ